MINNKTNIAFLTHGDRNLGGGEQSWYFLITKLNKTLFNPIVFVAQQNSFTENLKKHKIPIHKIQINKKFTSIYRDQVRYNPIIIFQYICFLLKASWNLFRLLKAHRIQILHVHDNLVKIIGIPAAKFARVKIIQIVMINLAMHLLIRYYYFVKNILWIEFFAYQSL